MKLLSTDQCDLVMEAKYISEKGCATDFVNMNIVDFVAIIRILANDISGEYSPQVLPYYAFYCSGQVILACFFSF